MLRRCCVVLCCCDAKGCCRWRRSFGLPRGCFFLLLFSSRPPITLPAAHGPPFSSNTLRDRLTTTAVDTPTATETADDSRAESTRKILPAKKQGRRDMPDECIHVHIHFCYRCAMPNVYDHMYCVQRLSMYVLREDGPLPRETSFYMDDYRFFIMTGMYNIIFITSPHNNLDTDTVY